MVDETLSTDNKMLQLIYYDLTFKYLSIKKVKTSRIISNLQNLTKIKISTIRLQSSAVKVVEKVLS